MAELKYCPCEHSEGMAKNSIGEEIVFCELTSRWMNITLGDCLGNCDMEERQADDGE